MDENERQSEERGWATAKTLAEALPYIQIYDRETVVIKYGGHAMGEEETALRFGRDIALLEQVGRAMRRVVVESVQQHQVRAHLLQHGRDLARMRIVTFQLADQAAGLVGEQRGVVSGNAHRGLVWRGISALRGGSAAGGQGEDHRKQGGRDSHAAMMPRTDDIPALAPPTRRGATGDRRSARAAGSAACSPSCDDRRSSSRGRGRGSFGWCRCG